MTRTIIGKADVTREQVDAWNRMLETSRGTNKFYIFLLYKEYRDSNGKWHGLGHSGIRDKNIEFEGEEFYIRRYKDKTYIYWKFGFGMERWELTDLAKAYFGVIPREK